MKKPQVKNSYSGISKYEVEYSYSNKHSKVSFISDKNVHDYNSIYGAPTLSNLLNVYIYYFIHNFD